MAIIRPKLKFIKGQTYTIDVSDASNSGHQLRFTADSGTTEYTTGVTAAGTPGTTGATVTFAVPENAPNDLNYYCATHGLGMGNKMKTIIIAGSWYGDRALIMGGKGVATTSPDIEYINITTTGNAQSFGNFHRLPSPGDTRNTKHYGVAVGDAVYGVYSGGRGFANTHTTQMDYLTIATLGNTSTFGDLPDTQLGAAGTSNGTIGLLTGGQIGNAGSYQPNDHSQEVYKFTIATPGNAVDSLHELTANNGRRMHGAVGNDTISIQVGGRYYDGSTAQSTNNMEYLTYSTTGSATTFGTMLVNPMWIQASGNKTRGIINGGISQNTAVRGEYEYITMATPGNSVDFGDMDLSVAQHSSTSNETRVVSTGGSNISSYLNNIQYVTIDTPGNGTDFGDLVDGRMYTSNTSGAAA